MQAENIQRKRKVYITLLLAVSVFAAGVLTGYLFKNAKKDPHANEPLDQEIRQEGYTFISPLLDCEKGASPEGKLIYSFREPLAEMINNTLKKGVLTEAAFYFRDLSNGPWYGINEKVRFQPASLLKLPVAMAIYKAAEKNPELLKKKIKFETWVDGIDGRMPTILPSKQIELGKEYTLEELIEAMLIHSDNQAVLLAHKNTPKDELADLYSVLGVENDVLKELTGTLSVRSFGTFYRILFNASYLNRQYSEKILRILSRSDYKKALVAGVPANIRVAHKFGEGGVLDGERQLQDCGIVYYPKNPYLICVMAKGRNLEYLEGFIQNVSAFVYERIDASVAGTRKK